MAEIEDTPIYREFERITSSGAKAVHHYWSCEIHAGEETFEAMKVINIEFARDYYRKISDVVQVSVMLPKGTYFHRIQPEKENLKVTLMRTPVEETGDGEDFGQGLVSYRMRAFLMDYNEPVVEQAHAQFDSESAANLSGYVRVDLHLMDAAIEQIRFKMIGGVLRDCLPSDALRVLLGKSCEGLRLEREERIRGIDVVEPDNKSRRKHVIVPPTKLNRLPSYIQENCGGIYSAGLGHYIQQGIWYIYPEFHLHRFQQTQRTLTVLNIPANKFPGLERTYYHTEGGRLVVLATGEAKFHDESEIRELNEGNGVRFSNADRTLESFATVSDNKAVVSRGENTAEFLTRQRPTGLNYAPLSPRRSTANPYHEFSQLSERMGSYLEILWENSDGELIYPGMPARLLYQRGEDLKEVFGIVMGAHTSIAAQGNGFSISRHKTNTLLTLFIEKH